MLEIMIKINNYLGNFDNIIGVLGLVIAIVGIVVGIIGRKSLKEVKNIKTQIKNSNVGTNQTANTINNNGLSVKDTEYIAGQVADQKIDKLPVIRTGTTPPDNKLGKNGDIYLQIIDDKNINI